MKIYKPGDICPCCGQAIKLTDPDALRIFSELVDFLGLPDPNDIIPLGQETGENEDCASCPAAEAGCGGYSESGYTLPCPVREEI